MLLENKSVVALLIFNTDSLAVPSTPPSPNKEPSLPKKVSPTKSNLPPVTSFKKPEKFLPPGILFIVAPIVLPTTLVIPSPTLLTRLPAFWPIFTAAFKNLPAPLIIGLRDPIMAPAALPNIAPIPGNKNPKAI